jgi:NAD(P)-dependent dehydrogenase (short-subunit alcohol dehydrogenase family)
MTAELLQKSKDGTFPKDFIPEERAGHLKDMAGVILFLASRAGGYVNGNVLLTDGGRLSILPATY